MHGATGIPSGVQYMNAEALVCVVDHDESTRKVVARLLQSEKYSIEYFASAHSFLNRKAHVGPCCLIVELHTPDLDGFNLQQILSKNQRTEQIIFISGDGDIPMCAHAFKGGAVDFLSKPLKEADFFVAVETALLRAKYLLHLRNEQQTAQASLDHLTPREREVLGFVIAGRLNKMIAAELGTTEKTIKRHRGHLMSKLKMSSVAELVHFCLLHGVKPTCPYGTKVPYTSLK
jgi:FixJ family two-component response regulator